LLLILAALTLISAYRLGDIASFVRFNTIHKRLLLKSRVTHLIVDKPNSMSKKLVIKINNLKDREPVENYDQHMVTTIHWNRIVAALVGLGLLIFLLVWILNLVFSSGVEELDELTAPTLDSQPVAGNQRTVEIAEAEVFKADAAAAVSISPPKVSAMDSGQTGISSGAGATGSSNSSNSSDSMAEGLGTAQTQRSNQQLAALEAAELFVSEQVMSVFAEDIPQLVQQHAQVASADPVDQLTSPIARSASGAEQTANQLNQATVKAITSSAISSEAVTEPQWTSPEQGLANDQVATSTREPDAAPTDSGKYRLRSSGSLDNVVIHADGITTAQLTSWVERRKPVDRLGSVIYQQNDELLRVFLYTEMSGLAGRTLYHRWYLDEKEMAEVVITVRSAEVSASSSKFIDRFMRGNWQVRVTDDLGNLLISASFQVTSN